MKPYYDEDGITIYHGDCREILPELSGIDAVFTSPPYNLGDMQGGLANLSGGYGTYLDDEPPDVYAEWQKDCLAAMWETLNDDGVLFYNHKPIVRGGLVRLPTEYNPGLPLRQIIIWYRRLGVNWSPTHFLPVHEWVMMFAKPSFRLRSKSDSHLSDVWMIPPDLKDNEHPAPFPVQLPLTALRAIEASVVLDPFMGSGTTLRAAKDLGLKAIGVDVDERYCEIAVQRLAQGVLPLEGDQ